MFHGARSLGRLNRDVIAAVIAKHAPSSRTHLPNTARRAFDGQAKKCEPAYFFERAPTKGSG
jgi:hypothetical protein